MLVILSKLVFPHILPVSFMFGVIGFISKECHIHSSVNFSGGWRIIFVAFLIWRVMQKYEVNGF